MDPEKYEKTPAELPKPSYNLDSLVPQSAENQTESAAAMNVERGTVGGPQSATANPLAHQTSHTGANDHSTTNSSTSSTNLPQIADDNDLIEKEWITKAKQIVEQTKHDPRAQNSEISKVKAVYIKKRFNKDIKVNENQ